MENLDEEVIDWWKDADLEQQAEACKDYKYKELAEFPDPEEYEESGNRDDYAILYDQHLYDEE